MKEFLMLCAVAADFNSPEGDIFRITPDKINQFVLAPEWIKETLMYQWLVNDGSIKVADTKEARKKLENDPLEGMTADGKSVEKSEEDETPAKKTQRRKKAADAE